MFDKTIKMRLLAKTAPPAAATPMDKFLASQGKISWFPGHMTKALKDMRRLVTKVDLVLEVIDARIPLSCRNPAIKDIFAEKARMMLLVNKTDLACPIANKVVIIAA